MLQRNMRASRKRVTMICDALLLNAVLEELDVVATTELRIAAVMVRATSRRS
jgi:phosphoribosylformylglycinamidine (FGAM) synthase PurS component